MRDVLLVFYRHGSMFEKEHGVELCGGSGMWDCGKVCVESEDADVSLCLCRWDPKICHQSLCECMLLALCMRYESLYQRVLECSVYVCEEIRVVNEGEQVGHCGHN